MKQKPSEHETKTHKKGAQFFKISVITLLITGSFTIAFIAVFFPKKSVALIAAENAYITVDDERILADDNLKICLDEYHQGMISKEYLHSELTNQIPLVLNLEKESEVLKKKYKAAAKAQKVHGFKSMKILLGHLGVPVVTSFMGLYLLLLFFKEEDFFWRKVTLVFSLTSMIIGGFYVIWVFYPKPDLPEYLYILLLFAFAIAASLISFIIGRYIYKLSQIDLKLKNHRLLNFIAGHVRKKYINKLPEEDHKQFVSDYLGEIQNLSKK
ncbi:hypothetical protein [Aquimarina macrocephali]|uniref:hypothetical protein n=1 Tax=Aquimarina macrocephali TaxID=666563 RepID=UPI0004B6841F|nr:hypothetical protein [Aquimarina macrocephali]